MERGARRLIVLLLVLGGTIGTAGSSAFASAGALHTFAGSFTGEGSCKMTQPTALAIDEASGEVFVYDRAKNSVNGFGPTGECLIHFKVSPAAKGEVDNEGIAFDNSGGASGGDLYVVAPDEHAIRKFHVSGASAEPRGGPIRAESESVEPIYGIGVDGEGGLWLYQGGNVFSFTGAEPNVLHTTTPLAIGECGPLAGFAVAPHAEALYVGHQRENALSECEEDVVVKALPSGEPAEAEAGVLQGRIDNAGSSAVAVDTVTGQAYVDERTQIASFTAGAQFVQRFGAGEMAKSLGLAIDDKTQLLYAAAGNGGQIVAFSAVEGPPPSAPPAAGGALADERAWELVTPPTKFGSTVFGITRVDGIAQAAEDGDAITYPSSGPIVAEPPSVRGPEATFNVSRRSAAGWQTEDVLPPRTSQPIGYSGGKGLEYRTFSEDLATATLEPGIGTSLPHEPALSPEATETTLYRRDMTRSSAGCEPTPSTCYTALVSPANDITGTPFGAQLQLLSSSPNGEHVALESGVPLLAGIPAYADEAGVYEWNAATGKLALIDELPAKETPEVSEPTLGAYAEAGAFSGVVYRNAISQSGRRVFWSSGVGKARALYMRDTELGVTLRVDKAAGVKKPEEAGAYYWDASSEGTRVFFTDTHRLLPDASEETETEAARFGDLYVCEVFLESPGHPGCHLTDITASVRGAGESAQVQGVIGVSADGSYVYFVADGALEPQAGPGDCEAGAAAGQCTLYVAHHDSEAGHEGWEQPKAIATLTGGESNDWVGTQSLAELTSRVSPNGQYLAFMSSQELTGYDTEDAAHAGVHDLEVYRYDAVTNKLLCASCNPSGARPTSVFDPPDLEATSEGQGLLVDPTAAWEKHYLAGSVPGWTSTGAGYALYQSRYLTDSGRVFFDSPDELVPADRNHVEDVYEYEDDGEGTCVSATGCVALMSSGSEADERETAFVDASTSGDDVFFKTSAALSPIDRDPSFDIYDARVCTSEDPCLKPTVAEAENCESESKCRSEATSVPAAPAVTPTQTVNGTGNVPSFVDEIPPPSKPRTNAELLAAALKSCRSHYKKGHKRHACETRARKRYRTAKKASRESGRKGGGR
jgi:hypothetical protein